MSNSDNYDNRDDDDDDDDGDDDKGIEGQNQVSYFVSAGSLKASFSLWVFRMDRCPVMLATLTIRPALLLWSGLTWLRFASERCIALSVNYCVSVGIKIACVTLELTSP